jgi:hypothetical protein
MTKTARNDVRTLSHFSVKSLDRLRHFTLLYTTWIPNEDRIRAQCFPFIGGPWLSSHHVYSISFSVCSCSYPQNVRSIEVRSRLNCEWARHFCGKIVGMHRIVMRAKTSDKMPSLKVKVHHWVQTLSPLYLHLVIAIPSLFVMCVEVRD